MIGKIKYIGKSFGIDQLTDGKIYDVIAIEEPFIRIIDDSGEDYLYSLYQPSSMEDIKLCGKWEIIEDPQNILKDKIKDTKK